MKKKWIVLTVLASVAALCACKGGNNGKKGSDDTYSAVVGITQDLDSLDPHCAVAAGTEEVLFNVYEGLVKPSQDGTLKPALAESYQIAEDGMRYTFTLRKNVLFHNGKEMTADDVVYSIKRCAGLLPDPDPGVKVESALSVISTVEKTDESTIEINLKEPNTELLGFLTCAVIPMPGGPADSAQDGTADRREIGTGPYKIKSWTPLESFVIERFEDYYGEKPELQEVTFKICASNDAAFMELLSGQIDIFPYLTEEQASQLTSDFELLAGQSNLVQALFLNNKSGAFQNVNVRKALCYAVDKDELLQIVAGGHGNVIGSGMFPNFGSYYNASLEDYYKYRPDEAKRLLAAEGYDEKNPLTFTVKVPSNYDFHVATAQVLVQQLAKVNVKMNIQLIEWSTWLSEVYKERNFEATVVGLDAALAPSDMLKRYQSTASNNFLNYSDAEFDKRYNTAKNSTDMTEKINEYQEAQRILTEDAASVYLQDPAKYVAIKKDLTGFVFYPVYVLDMSTIKVVK